MKKNNFDRALLSKFRSAILIGLFTFSLNSLFAQSTIIGLRFNGQTANSVKLSIIPPGKGVSKSEGKVGDQLVSGTKLIIPPNTIVVLKTPGGQQKLSSTAGKPMEYTFDTNGKGENHTAQGVGAEIINTVSKTVGYNYRVNNGRGTIAASHGTVFTFTDYSQANSEKATVTTEEGKINIIDEVPVSISGAPEKENKRGEKTTKSVSRFQSEGEGQFTSTNQPVVYSNYDEAIEAIGSEVNEEADPDELADDLTCLGDLYMDAEKPQQAIKLYSKAVQIYMDEYGEEDLTTLETQLALADALMGAEQNDEANKLVSTVEEILLENLSYDQDDYEHLKGEGNPDARLLCDDISDMNGLLGWAYEIIGDKEKSDEYYKAMDNACK